MYNPGVPSGTLKLNQDYQNIQNNFTSLNNSFSRNHIPLPTVPNNGKHTFIELVNMALPVPTPPLAAGEGTVFTNSVITTGSSSESSLFYTPDASGNQYQLTRTITSNFAKFAVTQGWTFLPGGLIFNYGFMALLRNPGQTIIPFAQPYSVSPFSIVLTSVNNDNSTTGQDLRVVLGSPNPLTQFSVVQSSSSSTNIAYWMAIGK